MNEIQKFCPHCGTLIPNAQSEFFICLNVLCPKYGQAQSIHNLIDKIRKHRKPPKGLMNKKSKNNYAYH